MSAVQQSMKNIFQALVPNRNYGVGQKVTRQIWNKFSEPCYWEITRIRPAADLKHGKAYGKFTFRGAFEFDAEQKRRVCD